MCGDGPYGRKRPAFREGVPPHVRGWTPGDDRHCDGLSGAPACAGMDLRGSSPCPARKRCPRMCGDGPDARQCHGQQKPVPPHVRGWTLAHQGVVDHRDGAPACAGMDPRRTPCRRASAWCPRMCGDGPYGRSTCCALGWVPPHVRGWTQRGERRSRRSRGAPACAGMDPLRRATWLGFTWCPRICGDGPSIRLPWSDDFVVPPHVRGWTLHQPDRARQLRGAPACAGMDPCGKCRSLPSRRCPRMCGDGPYDSLVGTPPIGVPPHVRGWTAGADRAAAPEGGAPASAGMARTKGRRSGAIGRCPRLRGDGPSRAMSRL